MKCWIYRKIKITMLELWAEWDMCTEGKLAWNSLDAIWRQIKTIAIAVSLQSSFMLSKLTQKSDVTRQAKIIFLKKNVAKLFINLFVLKIFMLPACLWQMNNFNKTSPKFKNNFPSVFVQTIK